MTTTTWTDELLRTANIIGSGRLRRRSIMAGAQIDHPIIQPLGGGGGIAGMYGNPANMIKRSVRAGDGEVRSVEDVTAVLALNGWVEVPS